MGNEEKINRNNQIINEYLIKMNKIRKSLNLPLLSIKIRNCLRCKIEFSSIGKENFMCDNCRTFKTNMFDDENSVGGL